LTMVCSVLFSSSPSYLFILIKIVKFIVDLSK
jgi:hypothetical protein